MYFLMIKRYTKNPAVLLNWLEFIVKNLLDLIHNVNQIHSLSTKDKKKKKNR